MRENLFVSHPQVRVTFYPQIGVNLGRQIVVSNDPDKDDLISVQTTKTLKQPVGHFSVTLAIKTLKFNSEYRDVLRPGDIVLIEMGPDRPQPSSLEYQQLVLPQTYSGLEPVMVGSIDEVRESTVFNPQDGKPERSITVSGRDLAKYLVDDQIWWDSWSEPQRAITGAPLAEEYNQWPKEGKGKFSKPADIISFFVDYLRRHFEVTFHKIGSLNDVGLFTDLLRTSLTLDSPGVSAQVAILAAHGAPWALMERQASAPLYVLCLDTRRKLDVNRLLSPTGGNRIDNEQTLYFNTRDGHWDSQVALMLYRNPWSCRDYEGDWTNLPTRVIEDMDVMNMDLARSNDDISNTWRVWAEVQGVYRTEGGGGILQADKLRDYESIRRYGNRPLIQDTPFISGVGGADQKEIVAKYSFRLKDWNRWNEWYLNGKIQIKGMASVKSGDRLWHWDTNFGEYQGKAGFVGGADYYVDGVSQDFHVFTGWTTQLSVCRGQNHIERGTMLDYTDIVFQNPNVVNPINPEVVFPHSPDLDDPDSPQRRALRAQAKQIALWGI